MPPCVLSLSLRSAMRGTVVKNTGSYYLVRTDEGLPVECKVKGNLRLLRLNSTNPVAIGDEVELELVVPPTGAVAAQGLISGVMDRRNYIIRRATNLSKRSHILAANIDQALLLVTIDYPPTSTTFIDRFLASAEAYSVPCILAINKTDLYTEERQQAELARLTSLYCGIGYMCIPLSLLRGDGIPQVSGLLQGRMTLIAGHSGVGKSALVNSLTGREVARTAPISSFHEMGTHTTTFSEMYPLPGGGYVIDIPGIKGFGTLDFEAAQVGHYFKEIFRVGQNCRYSNCTHRNEPGCRVLDAVARGEIAESRYRSYLSILGDEAESKYREAY